MSIIYCNICDQFTDSDEHPCIEYEGELICYDCACKIEDEENDGLFDGNGDNVYVHDPDMGCKG